MSDGQSSKWITGGGGDRVCRVLQVAVIAVVRSPGERCTFASIGECLTITNSRASFKTAGRGFYIVRCAVVLGRCITARDVVIVVYCTGS